MQYLTDCVGYDGGHPRLVLVATQISTVEEMGIPPSPPLARRRSSSPTITYEHGELDSERYFVVAVLVGSDFCSRFHCKNVCDGFQSVSISFNLHYDTYIVTFSQGSTPIQQ
ncbi:hypothetical protein LWI28_002150 [Acer negundo]|uniref:Uncharacterized protein n=1 Tax=Acer negundo TaxID=4023 RepID=A0AAD5JMZ9_ACENE|nr:hypothetical protein LWI28_002150 [Acer negundo]